MEPEFSRHLLKNIQISNYMKIHRAGAELFRADGLADRQTDTLGVANSRFLQFCERA